METRVAVNLWSSDYDYELTCICGTVIKVRQQDPSVICPGCKRNLVFSK